MKVTGFVWLGAFALGIGFALGCGGGGKGAADKIAYPKGSDTAAPQAKGEGPSATAASADGKSLAEICAAAKTTSALDLRSRDVAKLVWSADKEGDVRGSASKAKAGDKSYSMADLQALEKKGQWHELMQHIEDIAPPKRDAAWDKLLERAATAFVGSLSSGSEAFQGLMVAEDLRKRYPALGQSKEFMAKRGDLGKTVFDECFKQSYGGEQCYRMADDFVAVEPNPEVMLAIAKVVRRNQNAYVAVPFFKRAVAAAKDTAPCKDSDLQLAIVAGLGLPPDETNATTSREIATTKCWAELKEPLIAQLRKEGSGYYLDNACRVLRAKGEVK
jgi:hypothetical protein